jgi:haloacetate dehalogenase
MLASDRRDLLRKAAALGIGTIVSVRSASSRATLGSDQAEPSPGAARFFPGFKQLTAKTSGATINCVTAGSGPPLLLLHGYPETHFMWRRVAPQLAEKFTVVAADLRGYGDSSKPPDGENHAGHSKRAMAQDQVELMASLGFQRFSVVGHDRGGRVTHRMALDHPDRIEKAVILDIVPTYKLFHNVTKEWATSSFHWFFLIQPAPFPETMIGNSLEFWVQSRFTRFNRLPAAARSSEALAEYVRCFRIPGTIHASCEDYRAASSIDLDHDAADMDHKISCPLLVLWGERGAMNRLYDVLATWRERASNVTGRAVSSDHFIPEENPEVLLSELKIFLG